MATNLKLSLFVAPLLAIGLLTGCSNSAAKSESNLKKVGLLMLTYSQEHDLYNPNLSTPETVKADLAPLLAKNKAAEPDKWSDDIFIDSVSGQPFVPNPNLSRVYMGKVDSPATAIAFYAPEPSGGKRLVGYMDGHVNYVDESQWPEVKKTGLVP